MSSSMYNKFELQSCGIAKLLCMSILTGLYPALARSVKLVLKSIKLSTPELIISFSTRYAG